MPDLAAKPVLEVPNSEALAGDLNISLPNPVRPTQPSLTQPNSSTQPVRLRGEAGSQAASFEQFAGQATNVLAIAAPKPHLTDVQIPRGLQNIPSNRDGSVESGAMDDRIEAAESTTVAKANGTSDSATGINSGGKVDQTSESRDRKAVQTRASASLPPQAAGSTLSVHIEPAVPTNGTQSHHDSAVTRITHPPKGKFDVVIMQTPSSPDDLGDLGSALMGSPIYTVYLQVGDRREWLLEYCLPSHRPAPASTYQVKVNDTAPVTPPYPVSTSIPTDLIGQAIPKHIVIHGYLTAAGNLQKLDTPGDRSPLAHELLSLLGGWRFRPAQRNMEPIEIEVLLVVPARS